MRKIILYLAILLWCSTAWAQLPSATGWSQLSSTDLNSVCAATHGFPAFTAITGCPAITSAWSGAAYDSKRDRLLIHGGGHGDYYGNETYSLNLTGTPSMTRLDNPGPTVPTTCVDSLDSKPVARHTYGGLAYIPTADRMYMFGGSLSTCGNGTNTTWTYDLSNLTWTLMTTTGATPGGGFGVATAYDPVTKKLFLHSNEISGFGGLFTYNFSPGAGVYTLISVSPGNTGSIILNGAYITTCIDWRRRKLWVIGGGIEKVYDLNCTSGCTASNGGTSGGSTVISAPGPGLAYDEQQDKIVAWAGGNSIYTLDPNTLVWTQSTPSGTTPGAAVTTGTFGRWAYSQKQGAFIVYNQTATNAWSLRVTATQPTTVNPITITETSGSDQSNRTVSVPLVFKPGNIANFPQAILGGVPLATQADVKVRWGDGSVKFAIVSWNMAFMNASTAYTVSFANQSASATGPALTKTDLLTTGYDFGSTITMTGATTPTVSARQILTDATSCTGTDQTFSSKCRYWLSGPFVTATILEDRTTTRTYDKDFGDGSKALHPIFEAWTYPLGQQTDLGATIENIWTSNTTLNSMRDLTYSLSISGGNASPTTKATNTSFNHIGKTRWHKRFWMGAGLGNIRITFNRDYEQQAAATPNWESGITIAEARIASQSTRWTSSNQTIQGSSTAAGEYDKAIGAPGQNDWIGMMPTWDIMYWITQDDRMKAATFGNADLAGRIPIFWREADNSAGSGDFFDAPTTGSVATFGRPISINARQTYSLRENNGGADCGGGFATDTPSLGTVTTDGWDITSTGIPSHMGDVGYMAYLTSGRYYYLEQLQLQAAWVLAHYVGCSNLTYSRNGSAGYTVDSELRGEAWGFRTLLYATFISTTGTPEATYFDDKIKNSIAMYEGAHLTAQSYPAKSVHYTWGQTNRQDSQGPSPLGLWQDNGAAFVQSPVCTDGSLAGAVSPWETHFLLVGLGLARDQGYATDNLLKFYGKLLLHLVLDPAATKYSMDTFRFPTKLSGPTRWIPDYTTWKNEFCPANVGYHQEGNFDHGYGVISMSALSYMTPYTIDGYSGQTAWNLYRSEKLSFETTQAGGINRFLQNFAGNVDGPKWDITPAPNLIIPPAPPTGFGIVKNNNYESEFEVVRK